MAERTELSALVDPAIALAERWARATEEGQTASEAATTGQLAALLQDAAGLDLAMRFVDRVARPEDVRVAARELSRISAADAAGFLGRTDRGLLGAGSLAARVSPQLVVPVARKRLRQLVGHLVVDAQDPALAKHLAASRADGFRLNINLLGELVLGEAEAQSRADRTLALLQRPDVDYVSIKVSSLVSQISTWDLEGTVERCLERLRPLYRAALAKSPHAFVNLDMEEYRDLDLTVAVFKRLLSEPEFAPLEAGIVLQAYLPDTLAALEDLIGFAKQRVAAGGAPVKVRLVKGANLAMEAVEAELHGWQLAPYGDKPQVDANYLTLVERALRDDAAGALRIGVASHNLYDVAFAHLLAESRGATERMDVEMLQGMSPSQARAVRDTVGTVILYTPAVAPRDFDVAVGYLVRRLEENAAPQNFLHAFFAKDPAAMPDQEQRFRDSVAAMDSNPVGPRRSPEPAAIPDEFGNTPDTDPALAPNRDWARQAVDSPLPEHSSQWLDSTEAVDRVVATALAAQPAWAARPVAERAAVLRNAARALQARRGELLTVMTQEAGKTVAEADPEISEAVDFARYYARCAEELETGLMADGARFTPDRLVLVTPPWNFPVAIPIGGVLAALAAGSAVVIKPAPQTPLCVQVAAEALWEAGVPRELFQLVRTGEDEVGQALISHPDVDTVLLTGATATAELFSGWRQTHPRGPRVYGETSGKNALVITPSADYDLAVSDLVKSAFGHAGQKCSAASLGILVGSAGDSKRLRTQLVDAVKSLRVGWPQDLGTGMGPLIEPPSDKLRRALTTLEPGETWLVEPRQLDDEGRLWSPGVKDGVKPGSFFHLTEVFGPVLGLMHAKDLDQALDWQNGTGFGLTGGIHSLDEAEVARWLERVAVGNAYVNRHITGAIVQRQSFGGWKGSGVGPGAKAGGPNYVAQLGCWQEAGLPQFRIAPSPEVTRELEALVAALGLAADERAWLQVAIGSDAACWAAEFATGHDASGLLSERNEFRYRPLPQVWLRLQADGRPADLARTLLAARLVGLPVQVSVDAGFPLAGRLAGHPVVHEDAAAFGARIQAQSGDAAEDVRVRVIGRPDGLQITSPEVALLTGPVLANGRRELLCLLREQAISHTLHRFGHLPGTTSR
ncbi:MULTISPECIES: bifunctional proline dehydrogenase/L-glutamate gamma-semialdehyde dehydrogenase [unclassified Luteococcus]|uniref:bifunctional proline dehydrogenase/L-glutamate gamma-semialdehyde dehydrogenase n=1 Tax=unclassified Luteococcus TaxID=2639923 RepID=UPI00313AB09E